MTRRTSIQAEAAKIIRQHIKKNYPQVKARVTSDSGSMTTSVNVSVIAFDGDINELNAVKKELLAFVDQFQYGDFNSMCDIYEHRNNDNGYPQVKYTFFGVDEEAYYQALAKSEHELYYCDSRNAVFAYVDGEINSGKVAKFGFWRATEEEAIQSVKERIKQAAIKPL